MGKLREAIIAKTNRKINILSISFPYFALFLLSKFSQQFTPLGDFFKLGQHQEPIT